MRRRRQTFTVAELDFFSFRRFYLRVIVFPSDEPRLLRILLLLDNRCPRKRGLRVNIHRVYHFVCNPDDPVHSCSYYNPRSFSRLCDKVRCFGRLRLLLCGYIHCERLECLLHTSHSQGVLQQLHQELLNTAQHQVASLRPSSRRKRFEG